MAIVLIPRATLKRFCGLAKYGLANVIIMQSTINAKKTPDSRLAKILPRIVLTETLSFFADFEVLAS
jgi:hypothetical protein